MNRSDRRAWKSQADALAAICARGCVDIGNAGTGPARCVNEPVAVRALERGFAHVLRNSGRPHVMRLTDEEGQPLSPRTPLLPGWEWYMAVGIDRLGRASYISRPVLPANDSPIKVRRTVEAVMLPELQRILDDTTPVPIPGGVRGPLLPCR